MIDRSMNYISNSTFGCCCGFNESDKITISETPVLIDCETGNILTIHYGHIPGHTYRCENRWSIFQGFTTLGTFETKEQAQDAYQKIVDGLRYNNTVIDI